MSFQLFLSLVIKTVFGFLLISLCMSEAFSQGKGSMQGNVRDAQNSGIIPNVNVWIFGASQGATTDFDGNYKVEGIPEGEYKVRFSYLGYKTDTLSIKIIKGQIATLNNRMSSIETTLGEVIIKGMRINNSTTERAGISVIKKMSPIVTLITAEQINKSLVFSTSDIVRKLPGVVIQNNFVNIRGMNERYNMTFLNGMVAPSTETERRAFSYDMLPSNVIDRMIVYRSPAPELPADWGGGVIKIFTKNTGFSRAFQAQISTQYRPGSHFTDYKSAKAGKYDELGFDDGFNSLPSGFPQKGEIPSFGVLGQAAPTAEGLQKNADLGKSLIHDWSVRKTYVPMDLRALFNYYDSWSIGKMKLNNLTSLSYTRTNTQVKRERDYGQGGIDYNVENHPIAKQTVHDTTDTRTVRSGAIQNLSLVINENHQIEFRNLFNVLTNNSMTAREGFIDRSEHLGNFREIVYDYRSRMLYSGQIGGEHKLGSNKDQSLSWSAGYGYTKQNVPAQRNILMTNEPTLTDTALKTNDYRILSLETNQSGIGYSNVDEKTYTFIADYEKRFESGIFIKVGTFNDYKNRIFSSRNILIGIPVFGVDSSISSFYNSRQPGLEKNIDGVFHDDNFRADGKGFGIWENLDLVSAFDAYSRNHSAYAGINIPLINKQMNIYGGFRYEWDLQNIKAVRTKIIADTIERVTRYLLPSVNINYNFSSKLKLRAAYGMTLNRPQFREVNPYWYIDKAQGYEYYGNDSLKNAEIHNYDVRLEYYPSDVEFLSIGLYYKKLKNAIEPYIVDQSFYDAVKYSNTERADVYGVELEVRKRLDFIPIKEAKNLSVIINAALLKSEVKFQDALFVNSNDPDADNKKGVIDVLDPRSFSTKKRPLTGTAPYVLNASIFYDNPDKGTLVSLVYNIFGQRLLSPGQNLNPNYYERPRNWLDLMIRQRVLKYAEVFLGVQDIFNQSYRFYKDTDRNQYYSPNLRNKVGRRDFTDGNYKPGSYYSFGINFTF